MTIETFFLSSQNLWVVKCYNQNCVSSLTTKLINTKKKQFDNHVILILVNSERIKIC